MAGLFAWLLFASDYSEGVLPGTYRFGSGAMTSTLVLRADHTFHQELTGSRTNGMAEGTWRHLGEGGVAFSSQFLPVPGQEQSPDGSTYARINKLFGLFVTLDMKQYNVLWFSKSDGSGAGLVGVYAGNEDGYVTRLQINPDHTFRETVVHVGMTKDSAGTWILENGRINFLAGFFNAIGNPLASDERAFDRDPRDGHMQVEVLKSGSAVFRKRYF